MARLNVTDPSVNKADPVLDADRIPVARGADGSATPLYATPKELANFANARLVTLTPAATVTWDLDNGLSAELNIDQNSMLVVPTNVLPGNGPLVLFVNQDSTTAFTLAFNTSIMIASELLDANGDLPELTTALGATDVYTFVVDDSSTVHLIGHVTRSRRSTAITMDEVVAMPNGIFISHDFTGYTPDIQMFCNGVECQPLRLNTFDNLHYGTIWLEPDVIAKIEIIDDAGLWRTFESRTLLGSRTKPKALRVRYISPDVAAGAGNYSKTLPGNFDDVMSSIQTGDEVVFFEGTKPYFNADIPIVFANTITDVNFVAAPGEKPILSGAREAPVTWAPFHAGTARAGGTSTQILLEIATASGSDDTYNNMTVRITGGTGTLGEMRAIIDYTGSSQIADIDTAWSVDPDGTTTYDVSDGVFSASSHDPNMEAVFFEDFGKIQRLADRATVAELRSQVTSLGGWVIDTAVLYVRLPAINRGIADAGTATTIDLQTAAQTSPIKSPHPYYVSNEDDFYNGMVIRITGGTGNLGETRTITNYTKSFNRATVGTAWGVTPDGTTKYEIIDARDPDDETVAIPDTAEDFMNAFGDRWWIEGLQFNGYGAGTALQRCIVIDSSANTTIKGCTFAFNGDSALHMTSCTDLVIEDNVFIEGRVYTVELDWKTTGIRTEGATSTFISGCERVVIRNNEYHENADFIIMNDPNGVNKHIDIHDNYCHRVVGEGLALDGVAHQVRVWNNVFDGIRHALSMATSTGGPFYYVNNNVNDVGYETPADTDDAVITTQVQGSKFNFQTPTPVTIAMLLVFNNTWVDQFSNETTHNANGSRMWSGENLYPQGNAIARNNIFVTTGHPFYEENTTGTYSFDYNQYYTTNVFSLTTNLWQWVNTAGQSTFAAFQAAATPNEANGVNADPLLGLDGIPTTELPGIHLPGITDNSVFGNLKANKGSLKTIP